MEECKYDENIIKLREKVAALEQKILDQKESVTYALNAAGIAVSKAETAAEKRFDSVNEFRNTLDDQQRTLMPRKESEIRFEAIEDKMNLLITNQNLKAGERSGMSELWGYIIGAIGIIFGIATILTKGQ